MTTENTATTNTAPDVGAQGAHVAPEQVPSKKTASPKKGAPKGQKNAKGGKAKPGATAKPKKATPAKTATKAPKATKPKADGPREGSKTAQVAAMLQRKNGATLAEIMDKMGWQKHTVRGFMAAAMKKCRLFRRVLQVRQRRPDLSDQFLVLTPFPHLPGPPGSPVAAGSLIGHRRPYSQRDPTAPPREPAPGQ